MKDENDKTLGERMMDDERAARKGRVEKRLGSERRALWEAVGAAVAFVVLIFAVILGALWVAVKVVRIAWES